MRSIWIQDQEFSGVAGVGLRGSVLNTAESKHPLTKRQGIDPSREEDFGRMRRCQDALSVNACWIYVSMTSDQYFGTGL